MVEIEVEVEDRANLYRHSSLLLLDQALLCLLPVVANSPAAAVTFTCPATAMSITDVRLASIMQAHSKKLLLIELAGAVSTSKLVNPQHTASGPSFISDMAVLAPALCNRKGRLHEIC